MQRQGLAASQNHRDFAVQFRGSHGSRRYNLPGDRPFPEALHFPRLLA
jgi:hypothetical protein